MKDKKLLLLVVGFSLLLIVAGVLYKSLAAQAEPVPIVPEADAQQSPSLAPDFTAYDAEGNAVTLSEQFGKPIVLNFWASWCGPCKSEMPAFERAYQAYGEDVQFLMVNLTDGSRETVEKGTKYVEDNGYTFPVLFDTAYEGAIAYGVTGIPATYFINADGTVYSQVKNAIAEEALTMAIDLLLTRNGK